MQRPKLKVTSAEPAAELRLHELRDYLLIFDAGSAPGITLVVDDQRLWIRFRGDPIGNWRSAGSYLVFENDVGDLSLSETFEQAVPMTLAAIASLVPVDEDEEF
jgi:hypothetical protein